MITERRKLLEHETYCTSVCSHKIAKFDCVLPRELLLLPLIKVVGVFFVFFPLFFLSPPLNKAACPDTFSFVTLTLFILRKKKNDERARHVLKKLRDGSTSQREGGSLLGKFIQILSYSIKIQHSTSK